MNYEIKVEIKSLKKILCDDDFFYQIPNYQRPYSWDKDNVSVLIDDLIDAFNDNADENYFCGSLVLVKEDERYDVIDGQQRLTTFTILSCVLRDFFCEKYKVQDRAKDFINNSIKDKYKEEKTKLKFLTSQKNQNTFQETVIKGIIGKDKNNSKNNPKKNLYLENAHLVQELVQEYLEEKAQDITDINKWVNKWIEFIFEKVVITTMVCPNPNTVIQIFNTLNATGTPLSPVDILKSTLMFKLSKESQGSFASDWDTIRENLEGDGLDYTNLFKTYHYYVKASNPKTNFDKELLVTFKDQDSLEIIHKLSKFSECYRDIHKMNDKYIYCLKYLKHSIYWTNILTAAKYTRVPYFNELKKVLLAWYYQSWIGGGTLNRVKQTSFSVLQIIKEDEKDSFDKIKDSINSNLQKYNTTQGYKANINSSDVFHQPWIKPVLFLLEYFSKDDSNQNFLEFSDRKIQIEHIFPQNPADPNDWNFNEEDKEKYLHSLGNLTLLSLRKNVQASNFSFEKKKKAYMNKDNIATSFEITRQVFENNEWTPAEIEKRSKDLIKKLNNVLKLEE